MVGVTGFEPRPLRGRELSVNSVRVVCLNVWDLDPVATQLMLLCCVNPVGGKGGGTPRSVFGRFSGVKACCAIAVRRPGPAVPPVAPGGLGCAARSAVGLAAFKP
jgi:hypothetical protein